MRKWAALVVVLGVITSAQGKDEPRYPAGRSEQVFDGRVFDLVLPKTTESKPPYSLIVVTGSSVLDFAALSKDGYAVAMFSPNATKGVWSAAESKEILEVVAHLQAALPVAKDRLHALAPHDSGNGAFATLVAFDKRCPFVSFALVSHQIGNGRSPPPDARKRMGILVMGRSPNPGNAIMDPEQFFAGKVRSVEWRPDDDPLGPYYRYWLGAMEGRFTPGCDLSFRWIEASTPSASAKSAAKDPPKPSPLGEAKTAAKSAGTGALVYLWSQEDAAKPEAKALQNEVFFDPDVRAAVKPLVAVKLDRVKNQEAFDAWGLKSTPAVLVVDSEFNVLDRFEGAIAAKDLVKALGKAAPRAAAKTR